MLQFQQIRLPEQAEALRGEVREFLREAYPAGRRRNSDFTSGHDPAFSAALGAQGWLGMTWPSEYGGAARTFFERYVVTEEILAAGAPVSAHWIADRQSGPLLLRYGSEAQRRKYLPGIIKGESYFSIGMSEPNSGSDLASVRTMAKPVDGGWAINGTKLWSTDAHRNHYMIALVRTEPPGDNRHAGMSQFIIDLRRDEGITVRPIRNMSGSEDFNEVVFQDYFVTPDDMVGEPGNGWTQVTSELSYERSGPERFLSAFRILVELARCLEGGSSAAQAELGKLVANLITLRRMSISVAGMLENGDSPSVEAALVKELGNNYEKLVPEVARLALPVVQRSPDLTAALTDTLLLSPSFTLRGGTREILRGVIARGLGLR
ncbi:MAG: acyl-CoA dehydrogenase family protein [Pseudomonadota bacterium]